MSDIAASARRAYASGKDPIDWAIWLVEMQLDSVDAIRKAREWNPNAYPIFKGSLDPQATSCRVIGYLLDAGWTPPEP